MPLTTTEFWKLAVESQLLSPEQCQALGGKFARGNGAAAQADAPALADWLVREKAISGYHAKVLLTGRAGPFRYDDYQVKDRIDGGRLKGVFRALHIPTQQPVCLSFLSAATAQDPDRHSRIATRAAAAGKANHPCLWRSYHLADLARFKFVAAADHPGKTLEELLAAKKNPPPTEACRIVRQVALAVAELHAQGLPHGDLRASNIWLTPGGAVKLLHFPFVLEPPLPAPGGVPAELADLLAPEFARGDRPADPQGDVYALGCLLYQMLASRPLFAGGDVHEKLRRHATEAPEPLDRLNAAVPKTLAQVVGYMLAKDPAKRYQKAANVAEALLPYVPAQQANITPEPATTEGKAYDAWLASGRQGRTSEQPPQASPALPRAAAAPTNAASAAGLPRAMPAVAVAQPVAGGVPAGLPVAQALGGAAVALALPMGPSAGLPRAQAVQPGAVGMAVAVAPTAFPAQGYPQTASYPEFGAAPLVNAPNLGVTAERRFVRKRRRANAIFFVCCLLVVGAVAAGLAVYGPGLLENGKTVAQSTEGNAAVNPPPTETKPPVQVAVVEAPPVDPNVEQLLPADKEEPVWRSPTKGQPLDLRFMPTGVQAYVALRPAEILKHPEQERVLAGLGPLAERTLENLRTMGGTPLENMELAVFGLLKEDALALVVRTIEPVSEEDMLQAWGNPAEEQMGDYTVYKNQGLACFAPAEGEGRLLVAMPLATTDVLQKWLDAAAAPPAMLSQLESLRKASDADRHFTLIFSPQSEFEGAGLGLFEEGPLAKLRDPISSFLRSDQQDLPRAAMLSVHLGDDLFVELRTFTTTGAAPLDQAKTYRDRVREWGADMKLHLRKLELHPYGRNVLLQFPDMLSMVGEYTVAGVDDKHALVRCYLPIVAAHNLALGSQLAILERPAGATGAPTVAVNNANPKPKTLRERLEEKTSYKIPRSPLDIVVATLGETLSTEIELMGKDMQMEGITKNQQVELDAVDQSYMDIIKAILLKANKDDKLIYIFAEKDGKEILRVTTRAAAATRKDEIPPEFKK